MSGDVFIFIYKKRDKIKLLMCDRNGALLSGTRNWKKGTFSRLEMDKNTSLELVWSDLVYSWKASKFLS